MKNIFENRLKLIEAGETLYIADDFYDAALRIVPEERLVVYIKYRGQKERKIDYREEIVYQIEHGGEFISKDEYELF
jgi:predicted methyltransferase